MSPSHWFNLSACLLLSASGARSGEDRLGDTLPAGAITRMGTARLRHDCIGLAFSPDGKTFATAGRNPIIRVWEVTTGRELLQLRGGKEGFNCIAYSPDGKSLVSASRDGALQVWEATSGSVERTFGGGKAEQAVRSMVITPDGRTLVTAGADHAVRVWDLMTGKERRFLTHQKGEAVRIALSPDGKHFATAGEDGLVVRDINGSRASRFDPRTTDVVCLAFAPDAKALATVGIQSGMRLWDAVTGRELRALETPPGPTALLAFAPNGRYLAAMESDRPLRLWGVASGKTLRALPLPGARPGALSYSPDGKVLAACQGYVIHLWDLGKNCEMHEFPGHVAGVSEVRFSADGQRLTSAGRDQTARVWACATGKLLQTLERPDPILAPARIGSDVAVYTADRSRVRRVDLAGDRTRIELVMDDLPSPLVCLAVSPDGKLLAASGSGQAIVLYGTETGKVVARLDGNHGGRDRFVFSPDGKWIAGGGRKVPVIVWEVEGGKQMLHFKAAGRPGPFAIRGVNALAFTPDGRGLLTLDVQAILWELSTGGARWRSGLNNPGFLRAAFAPDGKAVVVGNHGGTIHVLEMGSGAEVSRFDGHRGGITALAFAPDGKRFASGSDDATALVWDVRLACKKAIPTPATLKTEQLAALWTDLRAEDAARAYRAAWSLLAAADQAVSMLEGRLHDGGTREDVERFAGLLRKLDSKAFAVRETAHKELEKWEDLPLPLARKEAEGNASLEVRVRLKRVLEGRKEPDPVAERLRARRCLEVLEHIGTPQARQVLKALGETTTEPLLKQEARASLERLQGR